ncbi:MAG: lactate utilization protein [Hyphomicrobiaceae bacterium]|nr:lactate utilization protein [Hyphomicrobiaceae bacterium]
MSASDKRRERMYAAIRAGLDTNASADRRRTVETRMHAPPAPLVPQRAQKPVAEQRALLKSFLQGQSATVIEVATPAEIPKAVAGYLRANNLPLRVRAGTDAYLRGLDWRSEPALERLEGPAAGTDEVGLSRVTAAIAETGTLVLASGADNPVTVTFLPETHIAVVEQGAIVGGFEGVWARLRARFGKATMSRTVNFVSGPSRTADIGGQLVMGAHGPRRLCVILVAG